MLAKLLWRFDSKDNQSKVSMHQHLGEGYWSVGAVGQPGHVRGPCRAALCARDSLAITATDRDAFDLKTFEVKDEKSPPLLEKFRHKSIQTGVLDRFSSAPQQASFKVIKPLIARLY